MPHLLIIAHAPLASALKAVAAHIDGDAAAAVAAVDVRAEQSLEETVAAGRQALAAFGSDEVLILTDVYGATPCNAARCLLDARPRTQVVVGVSVPALWRALDHRRDALDVVTALALAGGQRGLMQVLAEPPTDQGSAIGAP